MSSRLLAAISGKHIDISPSGTDIPIFFLDDSYFILTITPNTTVMAACLAVRQHLGLKNDSFNAMYEVSDAGFQILEDTLTLSKVLAKWDQSNPFGPRRLYYKRAVYLPKCPAEVEESNATSPDSGAHFLAFAEAEHHFLNAAYRLDPVDVSKAAACLLACYRGGYDASRDSLDSIRPITADLVPLYAIKGPGAPAKEASPRSHSIGQASTALTIEEMSQKILTAYKELSATVDGGNSGSGGVSVLFAQRMFIAACKTCTFAYGREFFMGKRTWKESKSAAKDGDDKSSSSGGSKDSSSSGSKDGKSDGGSSPKDPSKDSKAPRASTADAGGKDSKDTTVARTEDCFLAVGHGGITLLGAEDPLKIETYPFAKIAKWVVSRDNKIFAFNLDADEKIVYFATELAPYIERCVERNVEEMVRLKSAGNNEEDKWSPPRESSGPGVSGVAELVKKETRPKPVYASIPSPERQAAMLVTLGLAARAAGASDGPGSKPDKQKVGAGSSSGAAAGLPPYWYELKDAEGDCFYFHELTGETTWTKPKALPLPPNWTTAVDSDGDTYWVNVVTGESSWFPPDAEKERKRLAEGLPVGWSVHFDNEGDPFYRSDFSGKTQWDRPT